MPSRGTGGIAGRRCPCNPSKYAISSRLHCGQKWLCVGANVHRSLLQSGSAIKSIRRAWQNVTKKLKLKDCHQHGLRVAAITSWENQGIPEPLARRWCGHRRTDVHSVYEKFDEKKQVEWFARAGFTLPPEQRGEGHFIMLKRFQMEKPSDSETAKVAAGK
jgi:integrase